MFWNLLLGSTLLGVGALSGFFHTLSTVVLGIVIGAIGMEISEQLEAQTRLIASLLLVCMGLIYVAMHDANAGSPVRPHEHVPRGLAGRSKATTITTLSIAMLFSHYLEIETFFFTAGTLGWTATVTLSMVYTVVTIVCMVGLTALWYRGLARVNWPDRSAGAVDSHGLDHNEKRITGGILIALGIFTFFIEL